MAPPVFHESAGYRDPSSPSDGAPPFRMPIEDVFSIRGRGTVVTGRVAQGTLRIGDDVELVGLGAQGAAAVTGIEAFRKLLTEANAGDNVGLLLRNVERDRVERGVVVARPGSLFAYSKLVLAIESQPAPRSGFESPPMEHGPDGIGFSAGCRVHGVTIPASARIGADVLVRLVLSRPVAAEPGTRVELVHGAVVTYVCTVVSAE